MRGDPAACGMGFFKKLFGIQTANPTEKFPKRLIPPQMIWDTDAHSLAGIPLSAPYEALAPLGPCDHFKVLNEHYHVVGYHALGLEIEVAAGQVRCFNLMVSDAPASPLGAYSAARPVIAPAHKAIVPETTPTELDALLGPGEKSFEDEEETIYLHREGPVQIEASYTPDGRLGLLLIQALEE